MAICKKWAGKVYGTNTGNLYATFEGHSDALTGKIHLNDPVFGLAVYGISQRKDLLWGAHFFLRINLYRNGIPFKIVAPKTLKKFVIGKGSG
ncbi:hypothetical protein LCGC14_1808960, partial [marine sediment metagenome]